MVRKDFFFFLVFRYIYSRILQLGFSGNALIHLIDFSISLSPEPRSTCWFCLNAPVGFIAKPWGLLNDPSVIITHLKPLRPRSGAINNQIKPQNKHTISSIN